MSQIFFKKFKKYTKSFPFFSNKIKTKTYIKNLRHSSLQSNILDISEKKSISCIQY